MIGELVEHDLRALGGIVRRGELRVELVLAHARPVEHVGKGARDLPRLDRLVDRLGEAVDGDGVAVGRPRADDRVDHAAQIALRKTDGLQVCDRRRRGLRVAEHAVEILIGLRRLLGCVARRLRAGLQRAHDLAVFLGLVHDADNGVARRLESCDDRAADEHFLEAAELPDQIADAAPCRRLRR